MEAHYRVRESCRPSRRAFLFETSSLLAAAAWASRGWGAVLRQPKFADYPFQLGVASGDPAPDGFVLWTRLAPKPLEGGGMPPEAVEVAWQVCDDEAMTRVVREGATTANPEFAHSVHVEVPGLQPDRWYWYQFRCGGEISPKARARTLPAADTAPDKARFTFASCQHWEAGYFTAYEHMLDEAPDLVFHLGDYIYEGPARDNGIRRHVGPLLNAIDDYRNRHAQYKSDPALQAMHHAAPWIVTWDDHEFVNNYANDTPQERDGDIQREQFLAQRARAYQAYYEHMPLRASSLPDGPNMQLYRRVAFGRLADFFVLDTRQYRANQPNGDGAKPHGAEVTDPNASILGAKQREWLFDGLVSAPATWKVLAQQVMMGHVDRDLGELARYSMDQWPGYEYERRMLLKHLYDKQVSNAVVLTGDIHSNWANELPLDVDNPESQVVAAEFVGTSISSSGDGQRVPVGLDRLMEQNPCVKFHNAKRGYVRCDLAPGRWQSDYRIVEYVQKPGAPIETCASFVLEVGSSKLNKA